MDMTEPSSVATEPPDADDVSAEELGAEVRGAVVRLYRRLRFEKTDDPLGDTPSSVLATLAKKGAHSLRELSGREHVTPPAMNQTMNALVAAGYVVREADPTDGRRVLFVATPQGVAVTAEARRRRHVWLNAQLAELSSTERSTLLAAAQLLRRVADA
jgi:DNA-binding MarR family transcriptional regulator